MANVLNMTQEGLPKNSGFDSVRVLCSSGPNWDSFVSQEGVFYPIGKVVSYDPPYVIGGASKVQTNYSEFQKYVKSKIKAKLAKRGRKKLLKDESESENEEEDEDMKEDDAMSVNSDSTVKVQAAADTKTKLVEFNPDIKFPVFPNQITASLKDSIKLFKQNNFYYQNWQSEYVLYDPALVRVRFIVQLSSKS